MLTICTRCRTPYDRRRAAAGTSPRLLALCTDCVTGTVRNQGPLTAPALAPVTDITVLPRRALPVAS
jgi:hypothetical protein